MFLDLYAAHRNYPRLRYCGPGPDSVKTGRSNYRLEDTNHSLTGGISPVKRLKVGGTGGLPQVNVGPGTEPRLVSTERIYFPAVAPGIDRQTDFLHGGVFAQFDNRDNPAGARRGGNYRVACTWNSDRNLDLHSFRRLDLEFQHYIPFFKGRRAISLRAKSELTYASAAQKVPLCLQPVVGGSEDLRGSRPFHLRGDNSMVLNTEYRREIFTSWSSRAVACKAGTTRRRSPSRPS